MFWGGCIFSNSFAGHRTRSLQRFDFERFERERDFLSERFLFCSGIFCVMACAVIMALLKTMSAVKVPLSFFCHPAWLFWVWLEFPSFSVQKPCHVAMRKVAAKMGTLVMHLAHMMLYML